MEISSKCIQSYTTQSTTIVTTTKDYPSLV